MNKALLCRSLRGLKGSRQFHNAFRACSSSGIPAKHQESVKSGFVVLSQNMIQRSNISSVIKRSLHISSARGASEIMQFHLSDIGEGIKEVTIKEWFVQPGDTVAQFDQICEVQSDKASVTITSRFDGVIKKLYYQVDDVAQTGDPLVDIEVQKSSNEENVDVQESEAIQIGESSHGSQSIDGLPRTDRKVLATPAVRRMAAEYNLNLDEIPGTGRDGRVLKEDVLNLIEKKDQTVANQQSAQQQAPQRSSPPPAPSKEKEPPPKPMVKPPSRPIEGDKEINFTGFTRVMVKTMTASLQVPHFLYCDEIDMSELVAARRKLNAQLEDHKLSFMPFFIKATSIALLDYPILNSSILTDRERIVMKSSHNIGVAMDTPDGLIVPNIKQVQNLSLLEISNELLRLQDLGQRGKIGGEDLKDGTITLSNIGSIGGTYAAPKIVPPEVAIGALGKMQTLPRFDKDGNVVRAQIMNISWSADHRLIDGATMARFNNRLKKCIENPAYMLLALR